MKLVGWNGLDPAWMDCLVPIYLPLHVLESDSPFGKQCMDSTVLQRYGKWNRRITESVGVEFGCLASGDPPCPQIQSVCLMILKILEHLSYIDVSLNMLCKSTFILGLILRRQTILQVVGNWTIQPLNNNLFRIPRGMEHETRSSYHTIMTITRAIPHIANTIDLWNNEPTNSKNPQNCSFQIFVWGSISSSRVSAG